MFISRRAVLRGVGHSAAFGAIAAALPYGVRAAAPAGAAVCMSMLYQSGTEEGRRFDEDAYRDRHVPLLRRAYGDSVERVELRVAPDPVEGAQPSALLAAASIWIRDVGAFVEQVGKHGKEVATDIETITNVGPILQIDQVVYSAGQDRSRVPLDAPCVSTFFPAKEGGTWDTRYYVDTYLPKLIQAFGPEAILRIEASEGTDQAGPKRLHSAVHMYINNEAAFEAASEKEEVAALLAEGGAHTTLSSMGVIMRVHAAG